MRRIALPTDQIDRLPAAELERELDLVDERWHQDAALHGRCGLTLDPVGRDGMLRPQHDNALRRLEFVLNDLIESLARLNVSIPPDRPSTRLQRTRDRARSFAVFTRVADEDVRHRQYRGGRETTKQRHRSSRHAVARIVYHILPRLSQHPRAPYRRAGRRPIIRAGGVVDGVERASRAQIGQWS